MIYFTILELNPHNYPLTPEIEANLKDLIVKMSKLRELWGKPMTVNSGLRSPVDQMRINPKAPKSKHLIGAAVDISDSNEELKTWLKNNLHILEDIGLYCENFASTPNWVHFQIIAPNSGKHVFIP